VELVNSVATSALLVDASRRPLKSGSHAVSATFVPDDATKYASSHSGFTHVAMKASTRLTLAVHPRSLSVRALTVAPGVAVATGTVTFSLGGKVIVRRSTMGSPRFATPSGLDKRGWSPLVTRVMPRCWAPPRFVRF
jgi:hypothetical protein